SAQPAPARHAEVTSDDVTGGSNSMTQMCFGVDDRCAQRNAPAAYDRSGPVRLAPAHFAFPDFPAVVPAHGTVSAVPDSRLCDTSGLSVRVAWRCSDEQGGQVCRWDRIRNAFGVTGRRGAFPSLYDR